MADAPVRRLGKYEVVARIGQGAMGEVFRAHDPVLGREVAIKTMSAAIGADEELRQRFHREAQSAARLNHPNIVTVHDFGEEQGQAYMAMELLEGNDLKELIVSRAPLTLGDRLSLMEQIADGLAFAHAKGIVHRDLKPANIHVLHGGQVKIMDFGLARLAASEMTRAGMVMGTPNYMAPEQVRGEKATPETDVFALGAVFYEVLAYQKAFEANALHAVLFKVVQDDPAPLEGLAPGLPAPLYALVARALAKARTDRFPDAGAVRAALREVRAALGSVTLPAPPPFASGSHPPMPSGPPHPPPGSSAPLPSGPVPGFARAAAAPVAPLLPAPETLAAPVVTVRHEPPASARPQAAATVRAERAFSTPPPPAPTVRPEPVATLRPGETVRPAAPPPPEPPSLAPRPAAQAVAPRTLLVAGAAVAALAAVGVVAYRVLDDGTEQTTSVSLAPETPVITAPPITGPPTTVPPAADHGPTLAEARRLLDARDYRAAVRRAQAVAAADPGNAAALSVIAEAQNGIRRGEVEATALRGALEARDADRAEAALARLVAADPRHPEVGALSLRVNAVVREAAARERRAPPVTTPPVTAPPITAPPATVPRPPVTAPPVPVQSEAAARQAIRGVLDEYRQAFESLNADALRAVQPGVDHAQMKAAFASVTAYAVKMQVQSITVSGSTATATALVKYEPKPKPAGKIRPIPTVFRLKRAGEVWLIESIAHK